VLYSRPAVTFRDVQHTDLYIYSIGTAPGIIICYCPLASNKLQCMVKEVDRCNNIAKVAVQKCMTES